MEGDDIPPLLLQPTEGRRARRQASNPPVDPGVIYLLLLVTALAFGFRATQFIKIIWESLNLVTVLLAVLCVFLGKTHGGEKKNASPPMHHWYQETADSAFNSNRDSRREASELSNDEAPPFHLAGSDSDRIHGGVPKQTQKQDAESANEHRRLDGADSNSDWVSASSEPLQEAENNDERRRFHDDTYLHGYQINSNRRSEPPQEVENYDEWWLFRDDTCLNGYRRNSSRRSELPQEEVDNYDERRRFHDDTYLNGYRAGSNGRFSDDTNFPGQGVNSISDHGRDALSSASALEQQRNVEINGRRRFDGSRIDSNSDQVQIQPPARKREVKNSNERRQFYDDTYFYGSDQVEDAHFPAKHTLANGHRSGSDAGQMQVHPQFPFIYQKPVPSAPPLPESWPESPAEFAGRQENLTAPPVSPPSAEPQPQHSADSKKSAKRRARDLFAPFRRKTKKKKKERQRQKSVENLASLFDPQSSFYQSSIPPPSQTPDPPPSRPDRASESRESKTSVEAAKSAHKPPKPARSSAFTAAESSIESGKSSPLSSIPPSPPAPPFGVVPWRFEWDGDLVRAASFTSSMCASDVDGAEPSGRKDGNGASTSAPPYCSSPDVNTKAEDFIAMFRADLRKQKMNSKKA